MAEYIEREETQKAINTWDKFRYDITTRQMLCGEDNDHITLVRLSDVINCVNNMPSADVQPFRRGYWKDVMMSEATGWDLSLTGGRDEVLETVCSECGDCCAFGGDGDLYLSPYCPNCGARMDGDKNG